MSIALWFCPQQGSTYYELLKQLIMSMQTLFPSSILFEPHVTITTNLICENKDDVNKILTSCVAAIRSIEKQLRDIHTLPLVSFDSCSIKKQYFQKVILNCKPNKYLFGLEKIMTEMYTSKKPAHEGEQPKFTPHVSLLYSNVTPVSQAYVRMIEQRIEDTLDLRLKQVTNKDLLTQDEQVKWEFSRESSLGWNIPGTFKVVKCEGPVYEWEVLGRTDI
ncbi:similar to Saccharomyces cerevisiae YGR247W CPD1 Cyclic nucleotide phosphodiesterase, hydrolyzes ADP-ribose 1'', 2''-cyclic phosphate to ADP- ribose 1''-phosphate [Maudiozyma barnettii]|uniref:2',3'-cyclic-nucleotide 3'-phosphodiesterase n=1 Tax=Maudiozyma barnettii TaxID=61262 RepID=A0A8H2VIF2_9SACH|nr:similar to Saccharomyces cerevisiae YGR247W CPD1 Cyclic nucleotide phosphodiesterase, hydrolyzes ADP-ribose 1'', 2''-cyclic phosphate to ADP- ribose 1''-phosphate [Kazachstania barnettii]CAB4256130.1 similar to Saccharomyces cerevisiae YGR247W CPD1 Cyclic nucleotide phosphodiesterase, hydrolyzes ADP-ribose 1'', 2''-cyclic phosphate to ADP- ribose 1''-phosphate [Kazachstania barnettii]CAD1784738.1 similar to Saccharomyces cerevisiae YGR247W CPD1 Cyclic nucleotide phosphodiesterase, hydrolyzes A